MHLLSRGLYKQLIDKKGIHSIVSFSGKLREHVGHHLGRLAEAAHWNFFFLDAQLLPVSPFIEGDHKPENTSGDNSLESGGECPGAFSLFPENGVLFIHNAEDFMTLTRFKNAEPPINILERLINDNAARIILSWRSSEAIPSAWKNEIYEVPPWNYPDIERYARKRRYRVDSESITEIRSQSGGFPEYLDSLFVLMERSATIQRFRDLLRTELTSDSSPLFLTCKCRWLEILLYSKGFNSLKKLLYVLAEHPNSRLTHIAKWMRSTPQAVNDYLSALLTTGAVHRNGWRYNIVDPMFCAWLRQNKSRMERLIQGSDTKVLSPGAFKKKTWRRVSSDSVLDFD